MRRIRIVAGIILALILVGAVLWFVPTGDFVILPGVTGNLRQMVHVAGGRFPRRGTLLMVAVDLAPANLLLDLYARLTPFAELVPRTEILPPGGNLHQYLVESNLEMDQSQKDAEVAALRFLGYPARVEGQGALVLATAPGYPAAKVLRPGDVVVAVDGTSVSGAKSLEELVASHGPGSRLTLLVERHKRRLAFSLTTVPNPKAPGRSLIGVEVATYRQRYVIPVPIRIDSAGIGGPSAGLMFSLAIVQELRPSWNLTHGLVVAGTGAIAADGSVEPIGGTAEKVLTVWRAGAKVFLVPKANYPEARAEVDRVGLAGRLRLIPVTSLAEAVDRLRHLPTHGVPSGGGT